MLVEVDPIKEMVRIEDRAWPFQVDCRTNTATLVLEGQTFVLRPLFWQEKFHLARFAHLGEAFVKRHFLKICLAQDQPLPEDPMAQEAIFALARWINAPGSRGERLSLSLDAILLATVTLEVSRALGGTAAALDGREAGEVELLWQAARQNQALAAAESSPGPLEDHLNRIAVVPDSSPGLEAPPRLEEELANTLPVLEQTPFPAREPLASDTAAPKSNAAPLSNRASRVPPPGKEPEPTGENSSRAESHQAVLASMPSRADRSRFRVMALKPANSLKPPPAPRPWSSPGLPPYLPTAAEISPSPEIIPASRTGGRKFPEAGPIPQVIGTEPHRPPSGPGQELAPFQTQQPPFGFPPISSPSSSGLSPADKEELLAELGRRLDEAMADLGLDAEV